ncbi:hypothetical protein [Salmonirosea aquatica]|uniref:Uncharacterized protein n=1 Tax=Salmonirosea aquatica TaxID=2654236 RepID=A0A7C9FSG5_9BACT|nr:hypothetical protein [Cytophagaceae bacterium SJW1-29]
MLNFTRKGSRAFPIASAKEIEYEIISILKQYSFKKFIFIFDELDKVEMEMNDQQINAALFQDADRTYLNDLRERKQIIIKLLSSLKHLLTEAEAKFIFIAGREMFDASLADISDRQSALGSIFHYIFYVESFLKETKVSTHSNSNNLVEEYLGQILLKNLSTNHNENLSFLQRYWKYLVELKKGKNQTNEENNYFSANENDEDLVKIIISLQNFSTYLWYRCGGSPKKLIKLIEENFIQYKSLPSLQNYSKYPTNESNKSKQKSTFISFNEPGIYFDDMSIIVSSSSNSENKVFINFSFRQQYKFGFTSYLFYPFILNQKTVLENYSDSINVSTPYLMDSIIKFHPFAFSTHNLELLPELLSTNKSPELRFFVQKLIDYLGQNHIRETDSGLFKYKFFEKTHNEISYISKVFDEESAAFNFSLDESHAIQNHIVHKIEYLRNNFKDYQKKENASIESLLFLNDLLGDSLLFDESYKDAIISLQDALHDVPIPTKDTPIEIFLVWMRIKLKLSMVFDKMKYYEMAVGHLGLAMEVALGYLSARYAANNTSSNEINHESVSNNIISKLKSSNNAKIRSSSEIIINKLETPLYRELLHVTQHAILGALYVQEKFAEGITFAKLESYLKQYAQIHEHGAFSGYRGRDMMMGHFYASLGTILYFKNKTLPYRTTLDILEFRNGRNGLNNDELCAEIADRIKRTPVFKIGNTNNNGDINSELSFADYVESSYKELYEVFSMDSSTFRFSFITYISYKKSLATYLAMKFESESNNNEDKLKLYYLSNLIKSSVRLLIKYKNVHGARKLISLANIITKIADLLLPLYNSANTNEKLFANINIKDFVLTDTDKFLDDIMFNNENGLTEQFISSPLNNKKSINLSYLLQMYYLAGRLYAKAGRWVSYGFQLKKILMAIHNTGVLKNYHYGDHIILNDFLDKYIVKEY